MEKCDYCQRELVVGEGTPKPFAVCVRPLFYQGLEKEKKLICMGCRDSLEDALNVTAEEVIYRLKMGAVADSLLGSSRLSTD
jgi:hypothetical protein